MTDATVTTVPDQTVEEKAVRAVLTPSTFNFAEAVRDHSYPEFEVPVYLDEILLQKFMDVHDQRFLLEQKIAESNTPKVSQANALARLNKEYEDVVKELAAIKYVVKIRGISPEQNIKLEAAANEAFPLQYDESVNPITGAPVKTLIENDERDAYYATLLRQAHLVSVTRPDGAVDSDFSDVAKVKTIINSLPFLARNKIDEAIQSATITADIYRVLVDPVF